MKFELEINLGKETLDVLRVLAVGVGVTPTLLEKVRAEEVKPSPTTIAFEAKRAALVEEKNKAPKTEPVKVEPVKVEPVKVEPVKVEPIKVEPVKVEPIKVEPVKELPAETGLSSTFETFEELHAATTAKNKTAPKGAVKQLINDFGVTKLSELAAKPEVWGAFERALDAL